MDKFPTITTWVNYGAVGSDRLRAELLEALAMSEPDPKPMACPGVTYVSASYSKEYDALDFEAACDGPQDCGWAVDLHDPLAPDVTEEGMALLSEAHHAHSACKARGREAATLPEVGA